MTQEQLTRLVKDLLDIGWQPAHLGGGPQAKMYVPPLLLEKLKEALKKLEQSCSFCGRDLADVHKMVRGSPTANICLDCWRAAGELLRKDGATFTF